MGRREAAGVTGTIAWRRVGGATFGAVLVVSVLTLTPAVRASALPATPITSCDPTTVLADMEAGGSYVFQCNGTIGLTSGITVTGNLSLDATGHNVTLSYNNPNPGAVTEQRFAEVAGGTLTLTNVTVKGWSLGSFGGAGFEQGASGTDGVSAPDGSGG